MKAIDVPFCNSRGFSNIDLTIANNSLIADVNEWEISTEESLSATITSNTKLAQEEPTTITLTTIYRAQSKL
jgi:hypothetical protein